MNNFAAPFLMNTNAKVAELVDLPAAGRRAGPALSKIKGTFDILKNVPCRSGGIGRPAYGRQARWSSAIENKRDL